MKRSFALDHRKALVYALAFVAVLTVYLSRATASGLWFDESIEFYFSSTLRGPVPGAHRDYSMYERILLTYQPPLYNVLMYGWISVCDSEFWFRLAGIITTLIGGAGIYFALKEIMKRDWAAAGSMVYLLAGGVSEYALEAGEYNLMMCMLCWTLCFYLRARKRENACSLFGFFVFACLAAYSQYGAVFMIVPMYVSLLIHFLRQKKKIGELILFSFLAAVAAGLLVFYFLLPQMNRQASAMNSHVPVFVYGPADIFVSLAKTVAFSFRGGKWIQPLVVAPAGLMMLSALPQKNKTLLNLALLFALGWAAYYLLTACSVYGYNGTWNALSVGTANIGGRYSLMFAPLLSVMIVYGVYCACVDKPQWKKRIGLKKMTAFALCLLILYSAVGLGSIMATKKKDDIREAVDAWYAEEVYQSRTLVNKWDDALFQFYLTHHADYSDSYQEKVILAPWWETTNEAMMAEALDKLGLLTADDFYYLSKSSDDYEAHFNSFRQVLSDHGFAVVDMYRGASALVHAVRK